MRGIANGDRSQTRPEDHLHEGMRDIEDLTVTDIQYMLGSELTEAASRPGQPRGTSIESVSVINHRALELTVVDRERHRTKTFKVTIAERSQAAI